jgi:hypothetical protein
VSGKFDAVAGDRNFVARNFDAVTKKFDSVVGNSIFFYKFFLVCTVYAVIAHQAFNIS